jgi:hypothetical protein
MNTYLLQTKNKLGKALVIVALALAALFGYAATQQNTANGTAGSQHTSVEQEAMSIACVGGQNGTCP